MLQELWDDLNGVSNIKRNSTELYIEGFDDEDYIALYQDILEELAPFYGDDYETWYHRHATSHLRFQQSNARNWIKRHVWSEHDVWEQTPRQQLVILKFFIYRRVTSAYKSKVEQED